MDLRQTCEYKVLIQVQQILVCTYFCLFLRTYSSFLIPFESCAEMLECDSKKKEREISAVKLVVNCHWFVLIIAIILNIIVLIFLHQIDIIDDYFSPLNLHLLFLHFVLPHVTINLAFSNSFKHTEEAHFS